jgi:hypothetical protein
MTGKNPTDVPTHWLANLGSAENPDFHHGQF